MVRILNAYFPVRTVVLGVSEALLVALSFVAATFVWLGGLGGSLDLLYEQGFMKIGLVSLVLFLSMYYFDLYDTLVLSNRREVLTRLIQVLGTTCLGLAVLYYLYPSVRLGSAVLLSGLVLVGLALIFWRRLFLFLNRSPLFCERAMVLGNGALGFELAREFRRRPELGIRLLGYAGAVSEDESAQGDLARLGSIDDFEETVLKKNIRRVIVAMKDRRGKLPVESLLELKARGLIVQDGAEVYEIVTGMVPLESLRLSWLLFSPGFRSSPLMLIYKRVFSIIFGTLGLVLTAPILLIAAIAIRLDSPGPIIFRQKRVGKDGKRFTLYKFRSMLQGADVDGIHPPAEEEDKRFTRVGRWLRKTRVDELPQLLNILNGDMDFVGPRPFVPDQEEDCVRQIPFYKQRWSVTPGATGWAQINRGYCTTLQDNIEKLSYDLFYIKNMSIGLDLLILFQTIKILLLGRGSR